MGKRRRSLNYARATHTTRCAWIEIEDVGHAEDVHGRSDPTRGAGIEIIYEILPEILALVAPHTGCVD